MVAPRIMPRHACGTNCTCGSSTTASGTVSNNNTSSSASGVVSNNAASPSASNTKPVNIKPNTTEHKQPNFTIFDFQELLESHLDDIKALNVRDSVIYNIMRVLECQDPSLGGTMYECPDCGDIRFLPHTCKSRFCPSCGFLYSLFRADAMKQVMIRCHHRHMVFTIPEELRIWFRRHRIALNDLYEAVNMTLRYYAQKTSATENFMPGFICVLHTFGRDLKWNPHIHALVAEGVVGKTTAWKKLTFFDYRYLRVAFRRNLLFLLRKRFGSDFKKVSAAAYKIHPDGFYVRAPKQSNANMKVITQYVCRYVGRPVIALSRIDEYNRENDTITFHYNRHEDNKLVTETIPAMDFIKRLIVHIPDDNFKMIRYYGFYSSTGKHTPQVINAQLIPYMSPSHRQTLRYTHKWRFCIALTFHVNPLKCRTCGQLMEPIYHSYPTFTHYFDKGKTYAERKRIRGVREKQILRIISTPRSARVKRYYV